VKRLFFLSGDCLFAQGRLFFLLLELSPFGEGSAVSSLLMYTSERILGAAMRRGFSIAFGSKAMGAELLFRPRLAGFGRLSLLLVDVEAVGAPEGGGF
jgi:hypothetical protein